MHGKCIPARKVPVSPTTRHSGPSLDFIGIICGFRCYSVHELSTGWLNKGILMNEPELASIFVWCVYRGNPHQNRRKKKTVTNSLLLNQESYLIYETLTCIFFIVFQESKQISQISTESDIIIIFFFNKYFHSCKGESVYFSSLLGLWIFNIKLVYIRFEI